MARGISYGMTTVVPGRIKIAKMGKGNLNIE